MNHTADQDAGVVTEYGLVFDCAAQGCPEPHDDERDVMPRGTAMPVTQRVNGHAVRVVQRTVTYSPWTQVSPPAEEQQ